MASLYIIIIFKVFTMMWLVRLYGVWSLCTSLNVPSSNLLTLYLTLQDKVLTSLSLTCQTFYHLQAFTLAISSCSSRFSLKSFFLFILYPDVPVSEAIVSKCHTNFHPHSPITMSPNFSYSETLILPIYLFVFLFIILFKHVLLVSVHWGWGTMKFDLLLVSRTAFGPYKIFNKYLLTINSIHNCDVQQGLRITILNYPILNRNY